MPGVNPVILAVGLLLVTVIGDPPVSGTAVKTMLAYTTPGGGTAVTVPTVEPVACKSVIVGASAGDVVTRTAFEAWLCTPLAPSKVACRSSRNKDLLGSR